MLAVSEAEWMGWLVFVGLVMVGASVIPAVASLLRRQLPDRRSAKRQVRPLRLGQSPKTRRSPRHAVAAHRTFLTGMTMTAISLVIIPFVAALTKLHTTGLLIAIAFVVPSLVVVMHSRRRDSRGKPIR